MAGEATRYGSLLGRASHRADPNDSDGSSRASVYFSSEEPDPEGGAVRASARGADASPSRRRVGVALAGVALCVLAVVGRASARVAETPPRVEGQSAGSSLPVFVHIPRTGGTTVEDLYYDHDAQAGFCQYAFQETMNYAVDDAVPWACVPWHTPPKEKIPDSFAVFRSPYSRLASEWARAEPDTDPSDCERFSRWLKKKLRKMSASPLYACVADASFTPQGFSRCASEHPGEKFATDGEVGCHLLPQVAYANVVEHRLSFEEWDESVVPFLRARGFEDLRNATVTRANSGTGELGSSYCWDTGAVDPEAWALVNEVYAVDLRTLGYETRAAPAKAKASETKTKTKKKTVTRDEAELGAAAAESGYERSWDWPKCYYDPRNVA